MKRVGGTWALPGILVLVGIALLGADLKDLEKQLKDRDPGKRVSAAEALGRMKTPEANTLLARRLASESEEGVQVAIIDALKAGGVNGPEVVDNLIKALGKASVWQVVEGLADIMTTAGDRKAIDALNKALDKNKGNGRVKAAIEKALLALAGGGAGPIDSGGGGQATGTTFYGLEIKSNNYIFVIDVSGSMQEKAVWKPEPQKDIGTGGGGNNQPDPNDKPDGDRKIDIAKFELIKVLKATPNGGFFNIVTFSSEVNPPMNQTMVKMTDSSRKQAIEFVKALQPMQMTNIYDSVEKAFEFSGFNPGEEKSSTGGTNIEKNSPDTIYVLSDGMPNRGKYVAPADIRANIKNINKLRKITINTIGVFASAGGGGGGGGFGPGGGGGGDLGPAKELMKGIAEDNYGKYVER